MIKYLKDKYSKKEDAEVFQNEILPKIDPNILNTIDPVFPMDKIDIPKL